MRLNYLASASTLVLSTLCLSNGAYAQTPSDSTGRTDAATAPQSEGAIENANTADIVVTGSRIARRDYVAQSPIVTTDKAAIENAGTSTVDAYLTQLPQFQAGTGGYTNATGGGDVGQATLNLRGLGVQRNLVLLDGRRGQPGNAQGAIDINTIPAVAISTIEVITGGASATYGSDALSGVVNFKLRTRFEGLTLDTQVNPTSHGDGTSQQYGVLAGKSFLDGRLSVVVAGEYSKRDLISYKGREWSASGGPTASLPQGYYVPNGTNLPTAAAINSVFESYGFAPGTVPRTVNLAFNDDGTLFRNGTPGTNYRGTADQPMIVSPAGGVFYNGGFFNYLQVPLKRYNGYAHVEYDVSDDMRIYGRAIYSESRARSQGSPPTFIAPWQLNIPTTNPFIPTDLQTILKSRAQPDASFLYNGRFWQGGPRSFDNKSRTYQILAGVQGDVSALNLHYDLYAQTGKTTESVTGISGNASMSALRTLINAPDGGASICNGGFNPFGLQPMSQECLAYVLRTPTSETTVKQDRIEGTLTGQLFALPAGDVKFSLTGDYQRNSYVFIPDPAYANNDISSVTTTALTRGKISVAEIAGELLVPLLKDIPAIQALNLTLGYRYSKYNTSGSVSAYKADFDWRVAEPLLLRGGYQRAVRAPNIGELFLAGTQQNVTIGNPPGGGDPCDVRSAFQTGANAQLVRDLCIATGLNPAIAATYTQFTGAIVAQTAGNSDLKPEKADTFTLGAVFRPTFAGGLFKNFSLSVDFYDIKIKGTISSISSSTSLNKCFNGDGSNPSYSRDNYYCTLFQRDPVSGQFINAYQPFLNLGGFRTSGIDTQLDWRVPVGNASLSLSVIANYLRKFEIQNFAGTPFQDFAGTISVSSSYPRWKTASSLALKFDQFDIGMRWRYIAKMADSSAVTSPNTAIAGVPAYNYLDVVSNLRVNERMQLRLGITNLANKAPPIVGGNPSITNGGVYDVVGRAFNVGAKVNF